MKKHMKIFFILFIISILFIFNNSNASSFDLNSFDINNINLNSISESKKNEIKEVLENIDLNSLNISSIVDNVDTSENAIVNNIDTSSIDIDKVTEIYEELSEVISDDEIANLIKDNSDMLKEAGVSEEAIDTSQEILKTFDTEQLIDVVKNDLDINHLIEQYQNGASFEDILSSVMKETSTWTKIKIVAKLLFSSMYFRIALFVLIIIAIYSIYITSLIFKKAGKHSYITFIPIYRDIVHLKICSLSPWLLLLLFIPIIGWLALVSVAIIARFELSKSFGHGFFFGLGLLFFPIIFRSIIAFSNNKYVDTSLEDED